MAAGSIITLGGRRRRTTSRRREKEEKNEHNFDFEMEVEDGDGQHGGIVLKSTMLDSNIPGQQPIIQMAVNSTRMSQVRRCSC